MAATDDSSARPTEGCTTTESFDDHGVETAFVWAYLGSTEERGVPEHVEAALDDARVLTHEEFADRPDANLRTEVLPAFYRRFAGFHCAYRT